MSLGTGRSIAIGAVAGALVVGAAWTMSSSGSDSTAAVSGPARVTACNPGNAINMKIEATNTSSQVTSYQLTAYWFTSDGAEFLSRTVQTSAIEPGKSATVTAGNPRDVEDYKSGMRCEVKVVGQG